MRFVGKFITDPILDLLPIAILIGSLLILFSSRASKSLVWSAAATPLALIIGSGFLISAPLLYAVGGHLAPFLMFGLTVIAYLLGMVIRSNILYLEPILSSNAPDSRIILAESVTDICLAFAYVISISYYLYLLSSFALKAISIENEWAKKFLCIAVFWAIAILGWFKGLKTLEKFEVVAVNIKLAIIFSTLAMLAYYGWRHGYSFSVESLQADLRHLSLDTGRVVLGLLIMVQGFETSRYIGERHSGPVRISTMRIAQILSSLIYVGFVFLFGQLLISYPMPNVISETEVIEIFRPVSFLVATILILGALVSQFSAAVADLSSGGGLLSEVTQKRFTSRSAYLLIAISGSSLVLVTNVFQVVTYASKAFAFYYGMQCVSFSYLQYHRRRWWQVGLGSALALLCVVVILFGTSYE